jgi:hypothetical protein
VKKYSVTIYTRVWSTSTVEAESPEAALELATEEQSRWSLNEADSSEMDGYTVYDPETDKSWHDTDDEEEEEE